MMYNKKQTGVDFMTKAIFDHQLTMTGMAEVPLWIIDKAKTIEQERVKDFAFRFYQDLCELHGVPFNMISENKELVDHYFKHGNFDAWKGEAK